MERADFLYIPIGNFSTHDRVPSAKPAGSCGRYTLRLYALARGTAVIVKATTSFFFFGDGLNVDVHVYAGINKSVPRT